MTWDAEVPVGSIWPRGAAWLRVILRALPMAIIVFGGLAILLVVRCVERPLHGLKRPWTPYITVTVCRVVLRIMGLPVKLEGRPMIEPGGWVANHASWLDIFVLNATGPLYFIAKSEVAGWPGIGWLARATGTLFVERQAARAKDQQAPLLERLSEGHRMLFFPEGTSTDGRRVLAFKSPLFQPFVEFEESQPLYLQAIMVYYQAPPGKEARFYGWWGDMSFVENLAHVLAQPKQGKVTLRFLPARAVKDYASRKDLAKALERDLQEAFAKAVEADSNASPS
ncbi:MAG: lysophospholipid acyltransferase family protein [Pseudomonadota bacterium]